VLGFAVAAAVAVVVAAAAVAVEVVVAAAALHCELLVMGSGELKRILMREHPADYWKVTSTAPDHWKQHYDQTDVGHLI
jgi:hypothetical protein